MRLRIKPALAASALAALLGAPTLPAQVMPQNLRDALKIQLKATEAQVKQVEAGRVVSYLIDTGNPEDVFLVGIARIWATPAYYVQQYGDIAKFEAAPGVHGSGAFSTPPQISDLANLQLAPEEVDELKACRPGRCTFKIGQRGLAYMQQHVNWQDPDYVSQANRAFRGMLLEYLKEYQANGATALLPYQDQAFPTGIETGMNQLIQTTPILRDLAPRTTQYLREYPRVNVDWTRELFTWQVGDFGLKPVHRLTHKVIGKGPTPFGEGYLITSKSLFASHYFRSAIEFRLLVPGQDQNKGGMHYLVCVQRSYVDGLTGLKGWMIRSTILSKSKQSMARYIAGVKERVERGFNNKN
jgi:hypothetical protein